MPLKLVGMVGFLFIGELNSARLFLEEIEHPEDDRGFDLFEVEKKIENPIKEIPLKAF